MLREIVSASGDGGRGRWPLLDSPGQIRAGAPQCPPHPTAGLDSGHGVGGPLRRTRVLWGQERSHYSHGGAAFSGKGQQQGTLGGAGHWRAPWSLTPSSCHHLSHPRDQRTQHGLKQPRRGVGRACPWLFPGRLSTERGGHARGASVGSDPFWHLTPLARVAPRVLGDAAATVRLRPGVRSRGSSCHRECSLMRWRWRLRGAVGRPRTRGSGQAGGGPRPGLRCTPALRGESAASGRVSWGGGTVTAPGGVGGGWD